MEVTAQLNGIRIAPRKVRIVANLLKRKDVVRALDQLAQMVQRPILPIGKLLESAIANAENNFHMVRENLYVKNIIVDEGQKLTRYLPKGFGRASLIQKKTSRVRVILDERVPGLKRAPKERAQTTDAAPAAEQKTTSKAAKSVAKDAGTKTKKGGVVGAAKRLFQRKTI